MSISKLTLIVIENSVEKLTTSLTHCSLVKQFNQSLFILIYFLYCFFSKIFTIAYC